MRTAGLPAMPLTRSPTPGSRRPCSSASRSAGVPMSGRCCPLDAAAWMADSKLARSNACALSSDASTPICSSSWYNSPATPPNANGSAAPGPAMTPATPLPPAVSANVAISRRRLVLTYDCMPSARKAAASALLRTTELSPLPYTTASAGTGVNHAAPRPALEPSFSWHTNLSLTPERLLLTSNSSSVQPPLSVPTRTPANCPKSVPSRDTSSTCPS
mmetsp:Transcript_65575/g.133157  ORF Transcript_65575/g.133157 Transcript_65575/m.133157 type:complete len:217 (-) Transcript_65575:64-714(-)